MPTKASDWVGQEIAGGRYRIERILGEGGMGSVYLGFDANLEDQVVVKIPQLHLIGNEEFTRRFALEVRSLVKLNHPHIVNIRDVGTHDGVPYAVMQFLGGGSLADRQKAKGRRVPMSISQVLRWLPRVAEALDFVHKQGYLHRDIKPANLLFDEHDNFYVGDFGVAKALAAAKENESAETLTGGGVVGTAEYLAPEAIMGEKLTGAADQYALATTVFEALAGQRPFNGPNPSAVIVMQTMDQPPPLASFRPDLPAELCKVVHRGLSKKPHERFTSCQAFAKAFATAANSTTEMLCPNCAKRMRVKYATQGKRIRCPHCTSSVLVELPGQATDFADTAVGSNSDTSREFKAKPASSPSPRQLGAGSTMAQGKRPTPAEGRTIVQAPGANLAGVYKKSSIDSGGQTLVRGPNQSGSHAHRKAPKRQRENTITKIAVSLCGVAVLAVLAFTTAAVLLVDRDASDDSAVAHETTGSIAHAVTTPPVAPNPPDEPATNVAYSSTPSAAGPLSQPSQTGVATNQATPSTSSTSSVPPAGTIQRNVATSDLNASPSTREMLQNQGTDLQSRFEKAQQAQEENKAQTETLSSKPADNQIASIDANTVNRTLESGETLNRVDSIAIGPAERARLIREENIRRAKVQGALFRKAPLPLVGLSVEPQTLINVALGDDRPPYNPPTYSQYAKARYDANFFGNILPSFLSAKIRGFQTDARRIAETKGLFREEMLADIAMITTHYAKVTPKGSESEIKAFCELCVEFAVKYGNEKALDPSFFTLAEPESGKTVQEEIEELLLEAKRHHALYERWRYSDEHKALEFKRKAEDIERRAGELKKKQNEK